MATIPVDEPRRWVEKDFGIVLEAVERVDHGADELADVWRAVASDGVRYAVR